MVENPIIRKISLKKETTKETFKAAFDKAIESVLTDLYLEVAFTESPNMYLHANEETLNDYLSDICKSDIRPKSRSVDSNDTKLSGLYTQFGEIKIIYNEEVDYLDLRLSIDLSNVCN